ncbi:phosphopantothenoylcysteine decarboxylase [Bremerella cremea]|uniref:Phosphopantothenoylcysteine decarboxylase n=1 Tax=Bremerella cremea TaxID=1031537 RepID=A0A368KWD1_9BACT|nr:flavoprotein [Bremerella cremea]RCS54631.1 phosphopantothenoylcysteine decarboxylase [Bremerella cremea]
MSDRKVIIGVTGGIAAYKTPALVSQLVKADVDVTVVMTAASHHFAGAATLTALSGKRVHTELFDENMPLGAHIELARRASLLCIVPTSADFMAKAALGLADDLLSTLYLAFTGKVFMCPAMNKEMWAHPAVQRNVKTLIEDGVTMIGPDSGWQSCRVEGTGRMTEPDEIYAKIESYFQDK